VLFGGRLDGDSVTVRLSEEMLGGAEILPLFANTVMFGDPLVLTVAGLRDSENVNTTCELSPTLVAPVFGVMLVTEGGVVSVAAAVLNQEEKNVPRFPHMSTTPLVFTVTSIVLFPGNGVSGVNVTTFPVLSKE